MMNTVFDIAVIITSLASMVSAVVMMNNAMVKAKAAARAAGRTRK